MAAGRADCGLGVLAAAHAFGLDFVPVASEPYDLVLDRGTARTTAAHTALGAARLARVRAAVDALGGYDTAEMGERIAEATATAAA